MRFAAGFAVGVAALTVATVAFLLQKLDVDLAGMRLWQGDPPPVPLRVITSADPDLALATADLDAWADAHPCDCEAVCECE